MDYFIDVMTLPHTVGGWVIIDDLTHVLASIIFSFMVLWISFLYRRERHSICMQVVDNRLFKVANSRMYCDTSPLLHSMLRFAYAWIIPFM